jgi:hypothetical protein
MTIHLTHLGILLAAIASYLVCYFMAILNLRKLDMGGFPSAVIFAIVGIVTASILVTVWLTLQFAK